MNGISSDVIHNDAPTQPEDDLQASEGANVPTDTEWQYGHTGVSRTGRVRCATKSS